MLIYWIDCCGKTTINDTFRYKAGGRFRPHFDGPWVPEQDWASVYTVLTSTLPRTRTLPRTQIRTRTRTITLTITQP